MSDPAAVAGDGVWLVHVRAADRVVVNRGAPHQDEICPSQVGACLPPGALDCAVDKSQLDMPGDQSSELTV